MTGAEPLRLEPGPGRTLRDLLFERGVEFPCAGVTQCGGCKVRVLAGEVPVTDEMRAVLSPEELQSGWRLGCMAEADGPVTLEIAQWSVQILDDHARLPFEPSEGFGAVVDLGTTTLVAQLVDRSTGAVAEVETALNVQGRFGADLMSRIRHDLERPGELCRLIREQIGAMLMRLAGGRPLQEVLLVGNTAMHHLVCGLSVEPLAAVPFRSPFLEARFLEARELGWSVALERPACFLPCIGGFVGSDLLAGLVATGLNDSAEPGALLDLGTNGEIAVGDRAGIHCASTAAGPAFEGGRIGRGMRASAGAIDRVSVVDGSLECGVIGGGPPRGLCGSGLVDAAAAALELGWIAPSGRMTGGRKSVPLSGEVSLTQADIRELQLAKGAVAAGLELLLAGRRFPGSRVFLAGAFGNYVRGQSARRIGLLPSWAGHPTAAGNSALRGTRMLLLAPSRREAVLRSLLGATTHIELAADPQFQDAFVGHMRFPDAEELCPGS
ncbi:MAG: ASKHA domain-containing protein [Isosphaeraceae bacterium]